MTTHESLIRNLIGMDSSYYQKLDTYPPYNLVKHDDDKYVIEISVAGFDIDDINITVDNQKLIVAGDNKNTSNDVTYIHKGIASRGFTRQFYLAEYIEVVDATIVNGILIINLEKVIPEDKKPKTIKIVWQH